jgi:glycyl-tRNA synthetase (class II)
VTDTVAADPNDVQPAVANLETIVSLSKRRGFIFPSSEIYGGINAVWDYGPLGVELKNNVKRAWWKAMVQDRNDIVGLDAGILMHPQVWVTSGHVGSFSEPLPPRRAARDGGADPDRPPRRDGHEAPQPRVPQ